MNSTTGPHPPPLKSHISPDTFIHVPESDVDDASTLWEEEEEKKEDRDQNAPLTTVLFFITGNPGLIAYYHAFLARLAAREPTRRCVVVGFSLGGFELEAEVGVGVGMEGRGKVWSLQEQIELTERRVRWVCAAVGRGKGTGKRRRRCRRVVLLGHSVGAYIALEVVRRCAAAAATAAKEEDEGMGLGFQITGAILLTPTVADIALSRSGRVLSSLTAAVGPRVLGFGARAAGGFCWAVPTPWLRRVVAAVTGMGGEGEHVEGGLQSALDVTVAFLQSRTGVRQALGMGDEEMRTIREDRWGEEVWGSAALVGGNGGGLVKMVFYFAENDHWVADSTREELMRLRGRLDGDRVEESWKPRMVVDRENGLVHGWCIGQSGFVAEKVRGWVGEMLGE